MLLTFSTEKLSHRLRAMKIFRKLLIYRRFLLILFTPILLLPLPLIIKTKEAECAYTLFVVAIFWLTEALPLAVSALLPALMFPMFGIMASKEVHFIPFFPFHNLTHFSVASAYFKDFHLLLTGVICLATSIEKWNLHKRIALKMVMLVGVNPAWYVLISNIHGGVSCFRLTLGFMISCSFLSMWLSNTSTAAMVMPIVEAVAQQIISAEAEVDAMEMTYANGVTNLALELDENINDCEPVDWKEKTKQAHGYSNGSTHPAHIVCNSEKEKKPEPSETERKYRNQRDHMICKVMCLCIAYSSTVGGLTTITGTSTNLIFAEQFNTRYPDCQCINFGSWFILCIPVTIIILLLSWVWLQWLFLGFDFKEMFQCGRTKSAREQASAQVIKEEYKKLGPISYPEIVTLVLFFLMALLWFTRDPGFIPGWASFFPDSAVEPPYQKPILPLPITQKPQPPPETLKDAIVGIIKEKLKISFVCTYCSKAFRDSYHLRHQESCHTGIKLVSWPKKALATMIPLISTIAGKNSRTSLVSIIAGILSTATTSSSATNPSSSASATAMPVTQMMKKPSKPFKKNHA
ncbi:hypothetical protein JD844_027761 [Phrynosoma platyrhinos]|uniref:C2H2-type domain-containing protein n=1 Tax=Phrynosoma platyrhinos TaxID=52577 RepID=A0ABQ7SH24_PHRPL|nr:hypothetical protein JD844_027761 [Phrynosoma platyrhinos]